MPKTLLGAALEAASNPNPAGQPVTFINDKGERVTFINNDGQPVTFVNDKGEVVPFLNDKGEPVTLWSGEGEVILTGEGAVTARSTVQRDEFAEAAAEAERNPDPAVEREI